MVDILSYIYIYILFYIYIILYYIIYSLADARYSIRIVKYSGINLRNEAADQPLEGRLQGV
jgi:hypothetical protein